MTRKKAIVLLLALVAAAAVAAANLYFRRDLGVTVNAEAIRTRDLEAIVSASGRIQPKRQVNISANQMGRVTRVAVQEGERVRAGQFLLEIDPRQLEGQLQRGEAAVAAAQSALQQARVGVEQAQVLLEQARASLELARQNLKRQEELWHDGLTTREALERAQNEVALREADVRARQQEIRARQQEIQTREQQIRQEQAQLATTRYNLTQIIISSPIDGIVTRRNIEEGETAVVGTMNNPGSQLLTIADMSVIEAEVEVDETDIPNVEVGQFATVTIDAIPDQTFTGRVTEIGNSPIQTQAATGGQRQATTFKVVITLDQAPAGVRPGFTCTAEITTARRRGAVAVPIQALTVREMLYDARGALVREPPPRRRRGSSIEPSVSASNEPPPGHTRKETEGVFVVRDGRAVFTPVRIGIAGEQYFEVLDGLKPGDQVITGPFASVRELADGQPVRVQRQETARRN
ncbi:MAG TPA: efflux RND transporter periplasmic adaptor subunit [Vicinamibacterales bacterium]|nr:efflux RND transporter periplasmic adaptor subunit [Vicinamibacterales bacterium]